MTHVRTSPYYPRSNGKLQCWHTSLKWECIRERTPRSLEDAKRLIQQMWNHYNKVRLHSAIGHVTPKGMLNWSAGRDPRGASPEALEVLASSANCDRQADCADTHSRRAMEPCKWIIGKCKYLQVDSIGS